MEFNEQTGGPVIKFLQKDSGQRLEIIFDPELYGRRMNFDQFCRRNSEIVQNYNPNKYSGFSLISAYDRVVEAIGSFDESNYAFLDFLEKGYVDGQGHFTDLGFDTILKRQLEVELGIKEERCDRVGQALEDLERARKKEKRADNIENLKIHAAELLSRYGLNSSEVNLLVSEGYYVPEGGGLSESVKGFILKIKIMENKKISIKIFNGTKGKEVLEKLTNFLERYSSGR